MRIVAGCEHEASKSVAGSSLRIIQLGTSHVPDSFVTKSPDNLMSGNAKQVIDPFRNPLHRHWNRFTPTLCYRDINPDVRHSLNTTSC